MKTKTKAIVLTKKGEVSKKVKNALNHCHFCSNGKVRTGYYLGSGRFTTRHSSLDTVTSILEAQGYKYTFGNDSQMRGAQGEFVKCSKVAYNFLMSLTSKGY